MDMKNLQRTDFDFWTSIDTRWRDMDSLGHLNHAVYLTYMESARVNVYIQLGYTGIRKEMDESTILGSMDVHYLAQATHPATLDVGHRICRVGTKSFDFLAGVFQDDKLVCSALFKLVAFNYKLNKPIPVPEKIKENRRPIE
jgi:acyl-CoA thioester hydrolase